jgi:hypothetical protein
VDARAIAPRAYVVVEERKFLQPIRPTTVVVNNTTIINQTVNITNVKVVNNTVINEGPQTQIIEKASGQKVHAVPARELRHRTEAEVVTKERISRARRAESRAAGRPKLDLRNGNPVSMNAARTKQRKRRLTRNEAKNLSGGCRRNGTHKVGTKSQGFGTPSQREGRKPIDAAPRAEESPSRCRAPREGTPTRRIATQRKSWNGKPRWRERRANDAESRG